MWPVPMLFAIGAAVLEDVLVRAGETCTLPEDLQFSAAAASTVLSAIAGIHDDHYRHRVLGGHVRPV